MRACTCDTNSARATVIMAYLCMGAPEVVGAAVGSAVGALGRSVEGGAVPVSLTRHFSKSTMRLGAFSIPIDAVKKVMGPSEHRIPDTK
jgi:hypothetical protein